jgi:hypothetical protein
MCVVAERIGGERDEGAWGKRERRGWRRICAWAAITGNKENQQQWAYCARVNPSKHPAIYENWSNRARKTEKQKACTTAQITPSAGVVVVLASVSSWCLHTLHTSVQPIPAMCKGVDVWVWADNKVQHEMPAIVRILCGYWSKSFISVNARVWRILLQQPHRIRTIAGIVQQKMSNRPKVLPIPLLLLSKTVVSAGTSFACVSRSASLSYIYLLLHGIWFLKLEILSLHGIVSILSWRWVIMSKLKICCAFFFSILYPPIQCMRGA